MSANLALLIAMGVLYAVGVYLVLERSLSRVLFGLILLANGTNLLLLTTGGYAKLAPLFGNTKSGDQINDPLPQAFILTSIVISFAVTAFMLGLIYRSWTLARQDEVQDDVEDQIVANQPSFIMEEDQEVQEDSSEFDGAHLSAEEHSAEELVSSPENTSDEETNS